MPIYRRLPKRGFTNIFKKRYEVVSVGRLQEAIDKGKLDSNNPVTASALADAGVVKGNRDGVRLLGQGTLTSSLTVRLSGASAQAKKIVEQAGGSVQIESSMPSENAKDLTEKGSTRSTPEVS